MLISFSSSTLGRIVVDRATRCIRCAAPAKDDIVFVALLSEDRHRAIGFASDFQIINFSSGYPSHYIIGLKFDFLGKNFVVRFSDNQMTGAQAIVEALQGGTEWPSLWNIVATDPAPYFRRAKDLVPALCYPRLNNISEDLIAISQLKPHPTTSHLVKSLLSFADFPTIREVVPKVAQGSGYPAMFHAIREFFAPYAPARRIFSPHIDWGGPPESATAGAHTYGNPRILYYPPATVTFGRYCSIAEDVTIILANHIMSGSTTYPFKLEQCIWPSQLIHSAMDFLPKDVKIGNDVWIGRGTTILSGSTIGDGAIIGAESVVRGNVPPYCVYAGNPGKVIRERFAPEIAERFLRLKWWNWPDWKVDRHSVKMLHADPVHFLEMAEADME
uniref:CatB-related O-acetyltransferase n=1 Tax=Methylobacterium sp. B34 TaxID=95563 RepID=UPI000A024994|nr:CatB-related O-acetyltransferase [Methylobacterium sp. B34]